MLEYIKLKPFPSDTAEGREKERYRMVLIGSGTSLLTRVITLALMIISIKLTVPYLGDERFGIWMTISSLVGMLMFLDFGIGNALTNRVAHAATESKDELSKVISQGLIVVALISVIVGILLYITALLIDWGLLLKLKEPDNAQEAKQSMQLFAILFSINIFSNAVQRVFAGLQKIHISNVYMGVIAIIALMLMVFAANVQAGISWLMVISLSPQLICGLALLSRLQREKYFSFNGVFENFIVNARAVFHTGSLFFLLQVGTMVGWGADVFLISSALGASAVAAFVICQKMIQIISQPMAIINAPLWSAYADAFSRNETRFIKKTLHKSLRITALYSITFALLLVFFGQDLASRWTSGEVLVPITLILAFASWSVVDSIGNAFAMFMNGCGIVKQQVVTVVLFVVTVLPTKWILLNSHGVDAMIFGTLVTYILILGLTYGIIFSSDIKNVLIGKKA